MKTKFNHQEALELLRKYNQQPFHILHGLTVEGLHALVRQGSGV